MVSPWASILSAQHFLRRAESSEAGDASVSFGVLALAVALPVIGGASASCHVPYLVPGVAAMRFRD